MIEAYISELNDLKKTQYYEFVQYALGMKYYIDNNGSNEKSLKSSSKAMRALKTNGKTTLAIEYIGSKKSREYYVDDVDYKQKTFSDNKGGKYDARYYFDSLGEWIVFLIYGLSKHSQYLYEIIDLDNIGKMLFQKCKKNDFNIIVGAGINDGFEIGNWDNLIDSIRAKTITMMVVPGKNIPERTEVMKKFEKDMLNTNYIAPEILKEISENTTGGAYLDTIYENLYHSFHIWTVSDKTNHDLVNKNLYQIVRIACTKPKCKILTFNYDNVIEMVLAANFDRSYQTKYIRSLSKPGDIEIIHSHGFFPYADYGKVKPHALVLSSYEYMHAYKNIHSNSMKYLYNQLNTTNLIVGNSISDYEEQKTMYLHHKDYLSSFSFAFLKRQDVEKFDRIRVNYFLQMGIFPVFFDDFIAMNAYLKTI